MSLGSCCRCHHLSVVVGTDLSLDRPLWVPVGTGADQRLHTSVRVALEQLPSQLQGRTQEKQ